MAPISMDRARAARRRYEWQIRGWHWNCNVCHHHGSATAANSIESEQLAYFAAEGHVESFGHSVSLWQRSRKAEAVVLVAWLSQVAVQKRGLINDA